jgi:hypothetical protein
MYKIKNKTHIYNRQLYGKIGLESSFYGWKQRPLEALNGTPDLHPFCASASNRGNIITSATTITPNITTAIIRKFRNGVGYKVLVVLEIKIYICYVSLNKK